MVKIHLEKRESYRHAKLDYSDSIIPFTLTIGDPTVVPSTIYVQNYSGESKKQLESQMSYSHDINK